MHDFVIIHIDEVLVRLVIDSEEKGWLLCSYGILLIKCPHHVRCSPTVVYVCCVSMMTILVVEPLPQLAVTQIYPWTMVLLQSIINITITVVSYPALMPHTSKSAHGGGCRHNNCRRRRNSCSDHLRCWSFDPATATDSKFNTTDDTHRSYDWQKYEQYAKNDGYCDTACNS